MNQHHHTRRHLVRSWARPAFLFLGMACAASVQAATHFVTFINDAGRTVTSIEAAPAGTRHWHILDLGGSLIGGKSGEVAVRFDSADACKQDLSVTYRGMAPLTITGFDVCRSDRLRLGKALAKALRSARETNLSPVEGFLINPACHSFNRNEAKVNHASPGILALFRILSWR